MSYSSSKLFKKIYRKWQKRRQRGKFNGSVLEQAKKEYYALEDTLKMLGKSLSLQPINSSEEPPITEDKPPPEIEDEIVHVGGMAIRDNRWKELISIQKFKGTVKTLSPDQKMFLYLKSLFKNDK